MNIKIKESDGFLVRMIMIPLTIGSIPLDWVHESLKIPFTSFTKKSLDWSKEDLVGLYIELWAIGWTIINIFILLPGLVLNNSFLWYLFLIIFILRACDFCKAFLSMNFLLSRYPQRSLARSYLLLFLAFLEMGAITSTLQFLICNNFLVGNEQANCINVFYYSLRNMATVGGGDIAITSSCSGSSEFFFGVIRISQPLFSVLLVTLSIAQILADKKKVTDELSNKHKR